MGKLAAQNKLIIDLCGGTGSWSKPYKDAGHDVIVVTHPDTDIFDFRLPKDYIFGILAAPPCTMFSLARTTASTPRDLRGGMRIVLRCLKIIREAMYREDPPVFWALENPLALLVRFLGYPPLVYDPADYGDPYTKRTGLWGKFKVPVKNRVSLTDQQMRDCSINNRILPPVPDDYIVPADMRRQAVRRSITPTGFAQAFYRANH